jgi:hypothetical protein
MLLFLFVLICVVAVVFFRLRLNEARTTEAVSALLLPSALLGLMLLIVGTVYFFRSSGLRQFARLAVTRSLPALEGLADGSAVVLEGHISQATPTVYESYVAYVRTSTASSTYRHTPKLPVELPDGVVEVGNEDYRDLNWPAETFAYDTYYHLRPGDAVVVAGTVGRYMVVSGGEQHEMVAVEAAYVFAGAHADFAARMRRDALFPTAMSYVGWAAGVAVAVTPVVAWLLRLLRGDTEAETQEYESEYDDWQTDG